MLHTSNAYLVPLVYIKCLIKAGIDDIITEGIVNMKRIEAYD